MSILRTFHNSKNPFVQINRNALWDLDLPLPVVGLWARCLSRPNNWKFNVIELAKSCKVNKDTILGYIRILEEKGYIVRYQPKILMDGKSVFGKSEYIILETKASEEEKRNIEEELKKCFPQPGFPCTEVSDTEKSPLLNNDYKNIDSLRDIENDFRDCGSVHNSKVDEKLSDENCEQTAQSESSFSNSSETAPLIDFNPDTYKLKDGKALSKNMIFKLKWIEKNRPPDMDKILANILYYESWVNSGREVKTTHEKFLQWCINSDKAKDQGEELKNELWAKYLSMEHNVKIVVLKTVIRIYDKNGQYESFSKNMDHLIFCKQSENIVLKGKYD